MSGTIRCERLDEGVVRLVIDHQERRNAMNNAMWDSLAENMHTIDQDNDVRCVVLTGAGEQAFGAGADISEFEANRASAAQAEAYAERTHAALQSVIDCRHPVVAAIRGLCVGGGLELALCADLRIANTSARFGIPIKRLGLVVGYEEMGRLIETVGRPNALRILLEGDLIDAEEALRLGLVNHLSPDEAFDDKLASVVGRITEGAPLVARWHKKFANRLMDPTALSEAEKRESFACFDTEDFRIGYRAFLDKTRPEFTGR